MTDYGDSCAESLVCVIVGGELECVPGAVAAVVDYVDEELGWTVF